MPWYSLAEKEHYDVMNKALKTWHNHLHVHGVQVQLVIAHAKIDDKGESTGPAIKVHGCEALACVRVLKLKDRLLRTFDAEIMIDGDKWRAWPTKTRLAIFDHELTHLELCRSETTNEVKLDDLGRPQLKLKPHDFQVGWFHAVAERHKEHSVEVMQFRHLTDPLEQRQLYLPFLHEPVEY